MISFASALPCLVFASGSVAAPKIADGARDAWLIRPGQSIGRIYLGEQQAMVLKRLQASDARPTDEGDAAMGHFWLTWAGKIGHELDVYTVRGVNDSAAHPEQFVRQVRTESPSFHTVNGVRVGSSLSVIRKQGIPVKIANGSVRLFDNLKKGIAFEVKKNSKGQWRCSAILIHPKNRSVLNEYIHAKTFDRAQS